MSVKREGRVLVREESGGWCLGEGEMLGKKREGLEW